jgi:hypothetical protein
VLMRSSSSGRPTDLSTLRNRASDDLLAKPEVVLDIVAAWVASGQPPQAASKGPEDAHVEQIWPTAALTILEEWRREAVGGLRGVEGCADRAANEARARPKAGEAGEIGRGPVPRARLRAKKGRARRGDEGRTEDASERVAKVRRRVGGGCMLLAWPSSSDELSR